MANCIHDLKGARGDFFVENWHFRDNSCSYCHLAPNVHSPFQTFSSVCFWEGQHETWRDCLAAVGNALCVNHEAIFCFLSCFIVLPLFYDMYTSKVKPRGQQTRGSLLDHCFTSEMRKKKRKEMCVSRRKDICVAVEYFGRGRKVK